MRAVIRLVILLLQIAKGSFPHKTTCLLHFTAKFNYILQPGPFNNNTNGDFIAFRQGNKVPYLVRLNGSIPAVYMSDGAGRVQTNSAAAQLANAGIYGGNDWTIECWYMHNGTEGSTVGLGGSWEVPLFQFGTRGTSGAGASIGVGSNPTFSAGECRELTECVYCLCWRLLSL